MALFVERLAITTKYFRVPQRLQPEDTLNWGGGGSYPLASSVVHVCRGSWVCAWACLVCCLSNKLIFLKTNWHSAYGSHIYIYIYVCVCVCACVCNTSFIIILLSVLQQVHSLFKIGFSIECDLMLPFQFTISSLFLKVSSSCLRLLLRPVSCILPSTFLQ
jgi:hypothetical protein